MVGEKKKEREREFDNGFDNRKTSHDETEMHSAPPFSNSKSVYTRKRRVARSGINERGCQVRKRSTVTIAGE